MVRGGFSSRQHRPQSSRRQLRLYGGPQTRREHTERSRSPARRASQCPAYNGATRLPCHDSAFGRSRARNDAETQHQSCIETLKAAAGLVEGRSINGQPVRLLLENIDPVENPRYYLTEIAEAFQIVESVNHPQVQLLYDVYHQQIAAGNLISNLEKSLPHLGLVHIADVPSRHLPGTGEINYENIYRKLVELNYTGVVAMEFLPEGDPVAQLRAAREMAEAAKL